MGSTNQTQEYQPVVSPKAPRYPQSRMYPYAHNEQYQREENQRNDNIHRSPHDRVDIVWSWPGCNQVQRWHTHLADGFMVPLVRMRGTEKSAEKTAHK
jgi:hypothetical protein